MFPELSVFGIIGFNMLQEKDRRNILHSSTAYE